MAVKENSIAIQDYLEELSSATKKAERFFINKSAGSVDLNRILEFAGKIRQINDRLRKAHDPMDSGSRIIEQFFDQWNNIIFGVFYTADLVEMNKTLTAKQYDIFMATLKHIDEHINVLSSTRNRAAG